MTHGTTEFYASENVHNHLYTKQKSVFKEMPFYIMIIFMFICYVVLHHVMFEMFGHIDRQLFEHNNWDSYTYQALAWLNGRVDVKNYSWLEIAQYGEKYFVSFPPLPSVIMLPFAILFGEKTPNNLIIAVYGILIACFTYASLRKNGMKSQLSAFVSIAFVFGSNMLFISTMGGVWFQAQMLAILFIMCMIYCALCNKRMLAYAMVALAVGCRPFSIIAAIPLFVHFTEIDICNGAISKSSENNGYASITYIISQIKFLIIPLFIGLVYMWYNYIRFDNPFQFGHDYLPEFMYDSPSGQFNLSYVGDNLYRLLLYLPKITKTGFSFPMFNGFIFYIANPFFLVMIIKIIADVKNKKFDKLSIFSMVSMLLSCICFIADNNLFGIVFTMAATLSFLAKVINDLFIKNKPDASKTSLIFSIYAMLLLTCLHKTLGGWQFGARYTADFLPIAFFYMIIGEKWDVKWYEYAIAIFAIVFNVYGAIMGQI